ncbi:hypothetical protein HK405_013611, partial [Cladochytrium tenue]
GSTRWSELALHLEELLSLLAACGYTRGVDVHFMNRAMGAARVVSDADVRRAPARRVLLLLITDSVPTDGGFRKVYSQLRAMPPGFYASLVNCNDLAADDTSIMLWERSIPRFHGQSYYSEELRVARAAAAGTDAKATAPTYGRAAYVQDMVLGPFFPADAEEVRKLAKKTIKWRMGMTEGIFYGTE